MSVQMEEPSDNSQDLRHSDVPVPFVAWLEFRTTHNSVSVDRMVCNPELRGGFLKILWRMDPRISEATALWSLMTARKNKELRAFLAG